MTRREGLALALLSAFLRDVSPFLVAVPLIAAFVALWPWVE